MHAVASVGSVLHNPFLRAIRPLYWMSHEARSQASEAASARTGGRADGDAALERVRDALRGLRFGQITLVIHDGLVVQIERTEKLRMDR
jgi:hypothetical protein